MGVGCHEVSHIQQPVRAEKVSEAAATVQRMGHKRYQEAHTSSLVLQATAAGAPLCLLNRCLRFRLSAGRSISDGPAHWRPRLAPNSKPSQALPSHSSRGSRN